MSSAQPLQPALRALVERVQHNCHVADARHAAEMTLCTYLLQMREFYRWEQGLALGQSLTRQAVGAWMAERETLWERLAGDDYLPLPLPGSDGAEIEPFDVDAINAALAPHALVYGAGQVTAERPVFFIADLHRRELRGGVPVLQAGHELARTLLAPPAALGGGGAGPIVLRRESMARWAWERTEAFSIRPRAGGPLQSMLTHYGLDRDFLSGLPRWLDDQCEVAVWHELGEHALSQRWGSRWSELRASWHYIDEEPPAEPAACGRGDAPGARAAQIRRADALVRALRDQLADLGVTLPALLARGDPGPLHAWFAGYDGLREATFPDLVAGYATWCGGGGGDLLRSQAAFGLRQFESVAKSLLEGPVETVDAARAALIEPGEGVVPSSMLCRWPSSGR